MNQISFFFSERRIIYDYDKFGDSPTCLGENNEISGLEALVQGMEIIVEKLNSGDKGKSD